MRSMHEIAQRCIAEQKALNRRYEEKRREERKREREEINRPKTKREQYWELAYFLCIPWSVGLGLPALVALTTNGVGWTEFFEMMLNPFWSLWWFGFGTAYIHNAWRFSHSPELQKKQYEALHQAHVKFLEAQERRRRSG